MSVLVVGVSHRSAAIAVLERLALDADGAAKLAADVAASDHVAEVAVLATCNRVEVYADVERFHAGVEELSRALTRRVVGLPGDLVDHMYVHYDTGAVGHLYAVAAGLESMVVGEGQILGQVRDALRRGQDAGTVGTVLNDLFQQALRVGKRVRAETDIDRVGRSVVSEALDLVPGEVAGKRVVVVGAGSIAAVTVGTLVRRGVAEVVVANRTPARARRLAESAGARAVELERLGHELGRADLVVSCTGSTAAVVTVATLAGRDPGRRLDVLDLALPRDVDPAVAALPGVHLVALADLGDRLESSGTAADVEAVRRLVAAEVAGFEAARRAASVAPTVVALRSQAGEVVDAELRRLLARLPDLDPAARAEVEQTLRRVADKLLHAPTVRIKELAEQERTVSYADALADLFSLDPQAVAAVTRSRLEGQEPGAPR